MSAVSNVSPIENITAPNKKGIDSLKLDKTSGWKILRKIKKKM